MQVVCLDTHVLIWGIQGKASPERKEMIDKARKFLQYLSRNKVIILVPAVVLAELLMDVPPDKHERFIQKFSASYHVCPFGKREAMYFGKIWHLRKKDGTIKAIKEDLRELGISARSKIKFDVLIIATALAWKADRIISYDNGVKKLARDFIAVEEIPHISG